MYRCAILDDGMLLLLMLLPLRLLLFLFSFPSCLTLLVPRKGQDVVYVALSRTGARAAKRRGNAASAAGPDCYCCCCF